MADFFPEMTARWLPLYEFLCDPTSEHPVEYVGRRLRDVATADLVFYSVWGRDHLTARGTLVAISGEPYLAADHADWTIDWRHLARDRHLRVPAWAGIHASKKDPDRFRLGSESDDPTRRRFCNFVYSNPHCGMRNAFFQLLHQYEPVDALGSLYRNASHPALAERNARDWGDSKVQALQDYRFTIAFENEEHPGYCTEKIMHAWQADSVPIYWGDPTIALDFPPGSYLSLYEAGSLSKLAEQVLEAYHSPERYDELRRANPFRTGRVIELLERLRERAPGFTKALVDDATSYRGRSRLHPARRLVRGAEFVSYFARTAGVHAVQRSA